MTSPDIVLLCLDSKMPMQITPFRYIFRSQMNNVMLKLVAITTMPCYFMFTIINVIIHNNNNNKIPRAGPNCCMRLGLESKWWCVRSDGQSLRNCLLFNNS